MQFLHFVDVRKSCYIIRCNIVRTCVFALECKLMTNVVCDVQFYSGDSKLCFVLPWFKYLVTSDYQANCCCQSYVHMPILTRWYPNVSFRKSIQIIFISWRMKNFCLATIQNKSILNTYLVRIGLYINVNITRLYPYVPFRKSIHVMSFR